MSRKMTEQEKLLNDALNEAMENRVFISPTYQEATPEKPPFNWCAFWAFVLMAALGALLIVCIRSPL
jgi:hypothetical protein